MLASSAADFGPFLFSIAAVLIAAKIGGELAERLRVPSVLGEILAGIAIGPSALALVDLDDVLTGNAITVLAELGVLVLLLQVGMEMDLAELGKVGRSAMSVAMIGVAVPFAGGTFAAIALGQETKTAIFVGAALTATSVGITARVFGDLKALSTTESRVVLGAAVADDVLGLVILTIVVKVVADGSVGVGTVANTFGLAIGFLVISGLVGMGLVPRALDLADRVGSSSATIPAAAFVILFLFSAFANVAHLAPIIGAFMAGLALGRSGHRERIHRDTSAIGNLLMPVFFVQIGINTDIAVMGDPKVIGIAAVLLVIAVVGKLVSAFGLLGLRADRLLVGLGMVPRGEVGLIFASIGLANGVLDDELYASLLIVMLMTTLITPPALRWRLAGTASRTLADLPMGGPVEAPAGGWLSTGDDEIVLLAEAPPELTIPLALQAAGQARARAPGLVAARLDRPTPHDGTDVAALGHQCPRRVAPRHPPQVAPVPRGLRCPRASASRGLRRARATAPRFERARPVANPALPHRRAPGPAHRHGRRRPRGGEGRLEPGAARSGDDRRTGPRRLRDRPEIGLPVARSTGRSGRGRAHPPTARRRVVARIGSR